MTGVQSYLVVMLNKCLLNFLQDYALALWPFFWLHVFIYSFFHVNVSQYVGLWIVAFWMKNERFGGKKTKEEKYHKTSSGWEQTPQLSQIILFLLFPIQERSSSRIYLEGHYAKGDGLMRAEEQRQPRQGWKQVPVFHVRAAGCLPHLVSCGQNKQPHRSRDVNGKV